MNKHKSKSRFEIWIKLQRKIKSVSCRIEEATSETTKLRLIKKLKMLIKRLFSLNRKWVLGIATVTLFMWLGNNNIYSQNTLDQTKLNGANGLKIINSADNGKIGFDISKAGDINGDGLQDMLISSHKQAVYVIFGKQDSFESTIDVAMLDGTNGFAIKDSINAGIGISVNGAGDFNGDSIDDLIVGFSSMWYQGIHYMEGGLCMLYGSNQHNSTVYLNELDGINGFRIAGDSLNYMATTSAGMADVNNDGFDDIAFTYSIHDIFYDEGEVFLLYGTDQISTPKIDMDTLVTNGYGCSIYERGHHPWEDSFGGRERCSAVSFGDINGDNFDDIVIGEGRQDMVHVIFGSEQKLPIEFNLDTLTGQDGFTIKGKSSEYLGISLDVGDINGDGFDDIIAGNYTIYYNDYNAKTTVIFGKAEAYDALENTSDLNGTDGFEISGFNMDQSYYGYTSVACIDDVNGDSIKDILIGTDIKAVGSVTDAGKVYVVFGKDGDWPSNFDIGALNDTSGFIINGSFKDEELGRLVSGIGDLNNDGLGDFAFAGAKGEEAFVVFGHLPTEQKGFQDLDPDEGITVHVNSLGTTLMGTGDFNGDSNDDLLIHDWRNFANYIVFGEETPESAIINTDELDGSDGFKATTVEDIYDGDVVDINQDGFDDLVFGMPYSRPQRGGDVFVLFGKDGAQDAVVDIANLLDGESMVLYSDGSEIEYPGTVVSNAGDIDGDGFDDLYSASYYDAGIGSVIFSDENILDSLKLKVDVDSNIGFSISFPEEQFHKGDINGDGKSDIILKHSLAYWSVIFGQEAGIINTLIDPNNLNGTNGFEIEIWGGTSLFEELQSIADFNNDGYDDMLFLKSRSGSNEWGRDSLFLIYGHDGPFTHYDLDGGEAELNGSNGMIIKSLENGERINSTAMLDMNHDGWDDVVFSLTPSNEVYVVYGNNKDERLLDIANLQASQGYKIQGFGNNELTVEKGGDLNADGFNDLIILDKTTIEATERVLAHIVYGEDTQEAVYDISDLQNNGGYDLLFADDVNTVNINNDMTDFNGDGFEDLVFSAFKTTWSDYKILLSDRDLCATETIEDISICSGEDYTYPDGTTESNITENTTHESILSSVNGCDSTITTNITLNLIDVTVSIEENTLSAIELDADLYQWIDCDLETAIEGETNTSFTATESGNYAVIIENNGCKNVSACNSIEITGIDDKEGLVQSIWPNPTTGKITIRLVENDSPLELSIFDITGKLLMQKEVAKNETSVTTDLNGESGVYFIKLKSNFKTATYKLIKE